MSAPVRRPTMRDVASAAGVSVKTVSRVVNREPGVKLLTAVRVRAAAEDLGFTPNELARMLRTSGDVLETGRCPGCESLRRQCAELAGDIGMLAGALTGIRDRYPPGHAGHEAARAALDCLHAIPGAS